MSIKKDQKRIFKKFPKAQKRINGIIKSLTDNPRQGELYPGFNSEKLEVRKLRINLKEYKIGESKGLRLIYIFLVIKDKVIPLLMYQKKEFSAEHKVITMIQTRLKKIYKEA